MHELPMFKPDSISGAVFYLALFVAAALLFSRLLRLGAHAALRRQGHPDHSAASFPLQLGVACIWMIMLILYAHLIPALRAMGTALLTGASVASIVIGLAAQSTLGNLIAGIAITLYRPFAVGDTLVVAAPTGTETGIVEVISLGYTTLRTADDRAVILPNSLVASQATIRLSPRPR
jgi:small conductance mechanosensitive channel